MTDTKFTTLTKITYDIKEETDFIYEIETLIQCLILLFLNTQYISVNYQKYYYLKYKKITDYLINEKYFSKKQINDYENENEKNRILEDIVKLKKIADGCSIGVMKSIDKDF